MKGFNFVISSFCVLCLCSQSLPFENIICRKINGCKCVLSDGIRIDLSGLNNEVRW
jgi:hypothetical protein